MITLPIAFVAYVTALLHFTSTNCMPIDAHSSSTDSSQMPVRGDLSRLLLDEPEAEGTFRMTHISYELGCV
jgi:hypothetical protein